MSLNNDDWKKSTPKVFWGEIAPHSHVVQFYENNNAFQLLLEDFVIDGIDRGEGVIVIATTEHLLKISARLIKKGFNMDHLQNQNLYIPKKIDDILMEFMVNGWPNEKLFYRSVTALFNRVRKDNRKIRVFGEIVATLWAKGDCGATVHLEHLWDNFCETEEFCLYCAYPKSGFTQNSEISMNNICGHHSLMIKEGSTKSQIFYINVNHQELQ